MLLTFLESSCWHTRGSLLPSGCPARPLMTTGQGPGCPRPRGPWAWLPASGLPKREGAIEARERKGRGRKALQNEGRPMIPQLSGKQAAAGPGTLSPAGRREACAPRARVRVPGRRSSPELCRHKSPTPRAMRLCSLPAFWNPASPANFLCTWAGVCVL